MPSVRAPELALAELSDDNWAFAFWRILTDIASSFGATPEDRTRLFHETTSPALDLPNELSPVGHVIRRMWRQEPHLERELAETCATVWEWAELRGYSELALQFAEAAARMEPNSSARCSTAGRLCRRKSERVRGTMWFRRAVRIARLSKAEKAEIDFAIAHLGWGNLESDLGRFAEAEHHATKAFRAAMRRGRRSLAASAYHDLMTIAIHTERFDEAASFAANAVAFYRSDHPRLPALAHDVAFLWGKLGYFSSAAPLFEAVLSFISLQVERAVVLANLARAAGACRDRLRYERAFLAIEKHTQEGASIPASAFYHLAQGCRSFEEWERAERYCALALATAGERGNALIVAQAEKLSKELRERSMGDLDVLPPEGGEVDTIRDALIRKLRKHAAPGGSPGAVPPEKYPIER
jgi:tetratricopeptide (TPR) repeat protein